MLLCLLPYSWKEASGVDSACGSCDRGIGGPGGRPPADRKVRDVSKNEGTSKNILFSHILTQLVYSFTVV